MIERKLAVEIGRWAGSILGNFPSYLAPIGGVKHFCIRLLQAAYVSGPDQANHELSNVVQECSEDGMVFFSGDLAENPPSIYGKFYEAQDSLDEFRRLLKFVDKVLKQRSVPDYAISEVAIKRPLQLRRDLWRLHYVGGVRGYTGAYGLIRDQLDEYILFRRADQSVIMAALNSVLKSIDMAEIFLQNIDLEDKEADRKLSLDPIVRFIEKMSDCAIWGES